MSDLLPIAERVVEQAKRGEQVEAFVARGGETEVRVYEGDVEHFVSAQSEGIGIRVIRDGQLVERPIPGVPEVSEEGAPIGVLAPVSAHA